MASANPAARYAKRGAAPPAGSGPLYHIAQVEDYCCCLVLLTRKVYGRNGSPHAWSEDRGPRLALLLVVDDANSTLPYAVFRQEEDTYGYLLMLQGLILRRGMITVALYSDRHGVSRHVGDRDWADYFNRTIDCS